MVNSMKYFVVAIVDKYTGQDKFLCEYKIVSDQEMNVTSSTFDEALRFETAEAAEVAYQRLSDVFDVRLVAVAANGEMDVVKDSFGLDEMFGDEWVSSYFKA
jgi:hypothetical protein